MYTLIQIISITIKVYKNGYIMLYLKFKMLYSSHHVLMLNQQIKQPKTIELKLIDWITVQNLEECELIEVKTRN